MMTVKMITSGEIKANVANFNATEQLESFKSLTIKDSKNNSVTIILDGEIQLEAIYKELEKKLYDERTYDELENIIARQSNQIEDMQETIDRLESELYERQM